MHVTCPAPPPHPPPTTQTILPSGTPVKSPAAPDLLAKFLRVVELRLATCNLPRRNKGEAHEPGKEPLGVHLGAQVERIGSCICYLLSMYVRKDTWFVKSKPVLSSVLSTHYKEVKFIILVHGSLRRKDCTTTIDWLPGHERFSSLGSPRMPLTTRKLSSLVCVWAFASKTMRSA